MAMENPFEGKEIWFGVGSQDLYGEEALRQVAQQTGEMVDFLNATGKIPAKIVLKPTLKSSDGVKAFMTEASANPNVIGVITWCHTFSPAKMWIRGLEVLTKPLLQLATQHHKEIPWETIDMDFMNLNQAAHGDREFGYIVSRLGIPRKIVVGHYTDPEVAEKVGTVLARPYHLNVRQHDGTELAVEHTCTSSIGATLYFDNEARQEEILKRADSAMYRAKREGRNRICFAGVDAGEAALAV